MEETPGGLKVGVFTRRLGWGPASDLGAWVPKGGGDYDVIVVGALESSYKVTAEFLNKAHRAMLKGAFTAADADEGPGGHSPPGRWSWCDDDSEKLWLDAKPSCKRLSNKKRFRLTWTTTNNSGRANTTTTTTNGTSGGAATAGNNNVVVEHPNTDQSQQQERLSLEARGALEVEVGCLLAAAHDARMEAEDESAKDRANVKKRIAAAHVNVESGGDVHAAQGTWTAAEEKRVRLWQRASAEYQKILEREPRCIGAWYGLGLSHRALGDDAASLRAFDCCLKLRADGGLDGGEIPGAAWNARGRTLLRADRPFAASVAFHRAVAANPNLRLYQQNRAILDAAIRARAEATRDIVDARETDQPTAPPRRDVVYLKAGGENDDAQIDDDLRLCASQRGSAIVSTARRLAEEQRHLRVQQDLAATDLEHSAMLAAMPKDDTSTHQRQRPPSFFDLGTALKRGASHWARALRLHLGPDFDLVAFERAGQVRLRVYARRIAVVAETSCVADAATALTVAREPLVMPDAGAAAVALRFADSTTMAVIIGDLAARESCLDAVRDRDDEDAGGGSPRNRRTSHGSIVSDDVAIDGCSHLLGLRNKVLCSTLASLRLGDTRRGVADQFDHVLIVGDLGYTQDDLKTEIAAMRALAGWTLLDSPGSSSSSLDPSYSSTATEDAVVAPDRRRRPRFQAAFRSVSVLRDRIDVTSSSGGCIDVDLRKVEPSLPFGRLSVDKRRMPKLVFKDLAASDLPESPQVYVVLGVEPGRLLGTSHRDKLRSDVQPTTPQETYPSFDRCSTAWSDQLAVRLRCPWSAIAPILKGDNKFWGVGVSTRSSLGRSMTSSFAGSFEHQHTSSDTHVSAAAVSSLSTSPSPPRGTLLMSVWAADAVYEDALIGVARLALTDLSSKTSVFVRTLTLDGRATGVLRGTVQLVAPTDSRRFSSRSDDPPTPPENIRGLSFHSIKSLISPPIKKSSRDLGTSFARSTSSFGGGGSFTRRTSYDDDSTLPAAESAWPILVPPDSRKRRRPTAPWRHTWNDRSLGWIASDSIAPAPPPTVSTSASFYPRRGSGLDRTVVFPQNPLDLRWLRPSALYARCKAIFRSPSPVVNVADFDDSSYKLSSPA